MILKNVSRDVNGEQRKWSSSGAIVERQWGKMEHKWGMSGEFFYFILQFLKIKTKEFSFRMVFNKFSTYKYIQYTNTYKYSFQHFNIVFNIVFNKFSTYQKLLFLKINFFCATNNSTSHQLINKKIKKEKKIKKREQNFFYPLCFSLLLYYIVQLYLSPNN